jgi:hypothetical protein
MEADYSEKLGEKKDKFLAVRVRAAFLPKPWSHKMAKLCSSVAGLPWLGFVLGYG